MLEYPELHTIASQMQADLLGKTVTDGVMVKTNNNLFMGAHEPERYAELKGGVVTGVELHAPEVYIALNNGNGIVIGQCGGKLLLHAPGAKLPTHNICFTFQDGSCLTYTMMLWSLGIYVRTHEEWQQRKADIDQTHLQPLDSSYDDFAAILKKFESEKMPAKTFLSKHIGGVMSTFAAEILLYAKVYPAASLHALDTDAQKRVYDTIRQILTSACELGGRVNEMDLHGAKGRYVAMAERKNIGKPCPICGHALDKTSVGGVTAFCPTCQPKPLRKK